MNNTPQTLPQNIPSVIFSLKKPVELELGMGRSHFLFDRAKVVPGHEIIGI